MTPESKSASKGFLVVLVIVIVAAFAGRVLYASANGPPQKVIENSGPIKDDQKILAKNRKAYELFLATKEDQAKREKENNALGWCTDWSTLQPIPCPKVQAVSPSTAPQAKATKPAVSNQSTADANYVWSGAPPYKNDILKAYQKKLAARGITKASDVKLLVAQLVQENGSLSAEHTTGDHGCAVGILQYNACIHAHVSAKRFLQLHPEWKSADYQLEQMANMVAARYATYNGNIKQVVLAHNQPACAARNCSDTKAHYFRSVVLRTSLLITL